MANQEPQKLYDEFYYATGCGLPYRRDEHWTTFFGGIADEIMSQISPGSVLDAGCALGLLVEQLRLRGADAEGVDISEYAIANAPEIVRPFVRVGSITEPFGRRFDLIVCIEVLEHMPRAEAEAAIANLCAHSDDVLFSSTPLDFKEASHVNVHPIEHWAELFFRQGFLRDVDFDASFLTPWAIRFQRNAEPQHRIVRNYERRFWELWKANTDLRELALEQRQQLAAADARAQQLHTKHDLAQKKANLDRTALLSIASMFSSLVHRDDFLRLQNYGERLVADIVKRDQEIARLHDEEIARRDQEIAHRDEYIAWLESIIRAFEQGLVMSVMRHIRHSGTILQPLANEPPQRTLTAITVAGLSAGLRRFFTRSIVVPPTKISNAHPDSDLSFPSNSQADLLSLPPSSPALPSAHQPSLSSLMPSSPSCLPDPYLQWIISSEPTLDDLALQRIKARQLPYRPVISILSPIFNPSPLALEAMLASVFAQSYDRWELCLANASDQAEIAPILASATADPRVRVCSLPQNDGISANSNAALALANGDYVLLLDHDDTLAPNALFAIAETLAAHPDTDIIYFDEDKISQDGAQRHSPWFKPSGRSPDLMLSTNYLMHGVFRRELVLSVGGFDPSADGAQDWDLALRCFELTQRIIHIPRVLYHWRQLPGSCALDANAKPWALAGQEYALRGHLARIGVKDSELRRLSPSDLRVIWPTSGRLVSIIIPTRDKPDLLRACLESIFTNTVYPNYEIVLVDTGSTDPHTLAFYQALRDNSRVQVVYDTGTFNYSRANNVGAAHARGDLLLFLNNDTAVRTTDWLDELVGWVERPEVGVVGCRLVRPDGTTQHTGIVLGLEGHGSHLFDGDVTPTYGPFGSSEWYRNLMAVTGACLMTSRTVFDRLGGFDERYQVGYSDITFCVAAHARGLRVVYTPWVTLLHHEGASRGYNLPASDVARATVALLPLIATGDPYFSPNLSLMHRWPQVAEAEGEEWYQRIANILTSFHLLQTDDPKQIKAAATRLTAPPVRLPLTIRQPKLLLCTHDLSRTGAPHMLFQLACQLSKLGYEVTILAPALGPLAESIQAAGISLQVVHGYYDNVVEAATFIRSYDMVFVNTIIGWRVVLAAYAVDVPCTWWIHESLFGSELIGREAGARQAFALVDEVIFPVEATAKLYAHLSRQRPTNLIPYGLFKPTPKNKLDLVENERISVVVVASIEPRKGQEVLFDAITLLSDTLRTKLDIYLVGNVLDWSYYRTLRQHPAGTDAVYFTGMLSHEEALSYMAESDVFLLPSYDEVLPISLLEAMALGKAILVTDVGGISEAVRQGQEALVIPPGKPAALAEGLTTLLNSPELRDHLGRAAQLRYEQCFSEKVFVEAMDTVVKRLLSSSSAARL